MSVKKEPSGRRSVQVEVEVPGTPEEVWRAISTGPGISSWFVPAELEERLGGKLTCHFGPGMDSVATITAWEPPFRLAAESLDWGPNSPPIATEWIVEARSGGVCVVRVVHSLFAETDDWDDQLEGTESGWPVYFRVLRLYLSRFRGMHGRSLVVMGFSGEPELQAWNKLVGLLGLAGTGAGQPCKSGSGAPLVSGTVEWAGDPKSPPSLMLVLDEPAPGIGLIGATNCGGSTMISVCLYLYGDAAGDAVAQQGAAWQAWMNEHFPAPPSAA